ncbi:UDP-glucuronosyl and UDP-glucosyl transferase [Handroanthus impetiginosus]|uniref:Glycosyltransferase n=1 Tax=Handroanthus impetiginosus TaxID=429701 RepID=A0A2G9G4H1_9LAMI|nr:UDP-glucuronosyl and UDP-glucosyl transferase [Handroanthus impetiginosus]
MEKLGFERRRRVVLVPYPFQGHITPMLQLGSIFHSKGFSITIAQTKFNSPNPSNYPEFTFLPLSDNLDNYDTSFYNILNVISIMNTNCEGSFEDYMVEMLGEEDVQGEVACIVYDPIMNFVNVVANKLNLPTIMLKTTPATYTQSQVVMFQLLEEKLIPLPESQLQVSIPQIHPLRFKDLPLPATDKIPQDVLDFTQSYMDIKSSSAIIWNTANTLDHYPLQQLQQHFRVPIFPIGPFHKLAPNLTTSLMEEDNGCLSWLDKQAPNSVIYVSFGSLAIIDENALLEIARGLAKSEQPFLWVVRPSLLNGSNAMDFLPEDFKERTRERGCIVKWVPQRKVLAHPAVGGFFSHCGWNSTLESICEGVPLICMPFFTDQMVIARYMNYVWKVGVELENVLESGIEKGIRTLMVSEEGKVMRKRAFEMKLELEQCINGGGSSYESLDQLVEFIVSLAGRK